MFHEYPTSIPSAAVISLVLDALRDRQVDVKEAAHAAWHVIGYGLSLWDTHQPVGALSEVPLSNEEAAQELEKLVQVHGSEADRTMTAEMLPWSLILPIVIQLLLRLLQK